MGRGGRGRERERLFVRHFGTTELQGCAPLFNRGLGSLHTDLPHLSAFRSDAAFNGDDAFKPSLLFVCFSLSWAIVLLLFLRIIHTARIYILYIYINIYRNT